MKRILKYTIMFALPALSLQNIYAGNPDRQGASGAAQLQINPWARSSGWGNANAAGVRGIESSFLNIAGLATTPRTELVFNHCNLWQGTGIGMNSLGFSQAVGSKNSGGVLGITLNSLSTGDIERTTVNQPQGGLGNYSVQFLDLGVGYSKKFSESIYGGMMFKIISQGTSDARASGMALDAGIQYRTSLKKETKKLKGQDVKFGISIKNVGPDLTFRGDGLSLKAQPDNSPYSSTVEQRSAGFNLPSMVNIGASYDFRLDKGNETYYHRLTLASTYTSNSFSYDQTSIGLEYGYKDFLMIRGGFIYQKDIFDDVLRQTALTGYCMGFSLELPFTQNKSTFALDYSYRTSNPWGGVHTLGVRINLASSSD